MDQHIFRIGNNVSTTAKAESVSFLIDAADYYSELACSIRSARKQIWIVGWDFHAHLALTPDQDDPTWLDALLLAQLEASEELVIRILVWGVGPVYSGKSLKIFRRNGLLSHPRVKICFDFKHPFLASHHQKIVSIDSQIAFMGGIDLTEGRWDDSRHLARNPLRVKRDGIQYEPVHDVQVRVTGAAATAVQDVARKRWLRATREKVANAAREAGASPPPVSRPADLFDTTIALSLTDPQSKGGKFQSLALALDAIAAAKSHIYIEAQYLASFRVARALAARLRSMDAPEIVVIVTRISHGFIERQIMGRNRTRIIRKLKRQDLYDRLWVMYAVVPDEDSANSQDILIHSKLMIVDDMFLRIGSSNLNNRSERFDTEADLSLVANNASDRKAIAGLRNRLMAEHLGSSPEVISATFGQTGSLQAVIRANNNLSRGLRHFDVDLQQGSVSPALATPVVDPSERSLSRSLLQGIWRKTLARGRYVFRFLSRDRNLACRKKEKASR